MTVQAAPMGVVELMHKIQGSVEVARDLVGRSGALYVTVAELPEARILEALADAAHALSRVSEVLDQQLSGSLGPAA